MAKNPPTVRMRRLGAQIRKIREDRGLTLDQAADLLKLSKSALNRMENAQVITRPHEVQYLLMMYKVTEEDFAASLLGLASAGRSKEWVKRYGGLTPSSSDFVRLEQDSSAIRIFEPIVIPGLLQTPEYARVVLQPIPPSLNRDVDSSVAYRMARREVLLRSDPARLDVIIGEAALRQQLGGAEVMREQLRYLLEISQERNVSINVLPFEVTSNPGVDGPFNLLDVEAGNFTLVVIESLARSTFVEDETEVERYEAIFAALHEVGLSETDSRAMIERLLRE